MREDLVAKMIVLGMNKMTAESPDAKTAKNVTDVKNAVPDTMMKKARRESIVGVRAAMHQSEIPASHAGIDRQVQHLVETEAEAGAVPHVAGEIDRCHSGLVDVPEAAHAARESTATFQVPQAGERATIETEAEIAIAIRTETEIEIETESANVIVIVTVTVTVIVTVTVTVTVIVTVTVTVTVIANVIVIAIESV